MFLFHFSRSIQILLIVLRCSVIGFKVQLFHLLNYFRSSNVFLNASCNVFKTSSGMSFGAMKPIFLYSAISIPLSINNGASPTSFLRNKRSVQIHQIQDAQPLPPGSQTSHQYDFRVRQLWLGKTIIWNNCKFQPSFISKSLNHIFRSSYNSNSKLARISPYSYHSSKFEYGASLRT